MVQLARDANVPGNDDTLGPGLVPIGWHTVLIQYDELKPTRNNDGRRVVFKFLICEGENAEREFEYGATVEGTPDAVEIGWKIINTIFKTLGLSGSNTEVLWNKKFMIRMEHKASKTEPEKKFNNIVDWKPYGSPIPKQTQQSQQQTQAYQQPQQQPAQNHQQASNRPKWARR